MLLTTRAARASLPILRQIAMPDMTKEEFDQWRHDFFAEWRDMAFERELDRYEAEAKQFGYSENYLNLIRLVREQERMYRERPNLIMRAPERV